MYLEKEQKDGHNELQEMHWLLDLLQSIDAGLIVVDKDMKVCVWNSFMENHSGIIPAQIFGKNLLKIFPDIPENWLHRKVNSVLTLNSRSFTTWEQRPYLLKFKNYHPVTGVAEFMYQNITFIPLQSSTGKIERIGIIVYDVTDIAVNKLELKKANVELANLSRTDGLTQLYNRRHWEETLLQEYARFQRHKRPTTLIMFDIDHFKMVNDTYGHQAGDEVIKDTCLILRNAKRISDIAGRYGGEEFVVTLMDTDTEGAKILCERLRREIEQREVVHNGQSIKWTISLGIAELKSPLKTHQEWIEQADKALYEAKEGGRNCFKVYKD